MKRLQPGDRIPAQDYNKIVQEVSRQDSPSFGTNFGSLLYGVSESNEEPYHVFGVHKFATQPNQEVPVVKVAAFGPNEKGGMQLLVTNGNIAMIANKESAVFPVTQGVPMKLAVENETFVPGMPCGPKFGDTTLSADMPGFVCLTEKFTDNSVEYIWAAAAPMYPLYGTWDGSGQATVSSTLATVVGATTGDYVLTNVHEYGAIDPTDDAVILPILGHGWIAFKPAPYSFDVYWTSPSLYKVVNGGTPEVVLTGTTCP